MATLVFTGFSFGAAGGGFLSAWMISVFGWQSVVLVDAILPLVLVPILWLWMPESVGHMIVKVASRERIAKVVNLVAPGSANAKPQFLWGQTESAANFVAAKQASCLVPAFDGADQS